MFYLCSDTAKCTEGVHQACNANKGYGPCAPSIQCKQRLWSFAPDRAMRVTIHWADAN